MITKEQFKKTEGRLYRYYRQLKLIDKLKHKVVILYKQIQQIQEDIKNNRVFISPDINGIDYSAEKVISSSDGSSYFEKEFVRAVDMLDRELVFKKRKILKLNVRIRQMEEEIEDMKYNISMLSEECKRFVEWKYGTDSKNIEFIAENLGMALATAYRKREEIVDSIANLSNFVAKV